MVKLSDSGDRVLVRLSDVTQELTVGIGGAIASVRTLTDVSLEVRERELVVLTGSRGAGERAMLAVIAGDRRGVTGSCEVRPRTRVRIMRMGAQAALALTQEWQRCETLAYFSALGSAADIEAEFVHNERREQAALHDAPQHQHAHQPADLILLDVVPDVDDGIASVAARARPRRVRETLNADPRRTESRGANSRNEAYRDAESHGAYSRSQAVRPWDEKNRAALLAWASVCRQRGGAVVMAAGDAVGNGIFDAALGRVRPAVAQRAQFPTTVREGWFDASTVRVVPMHSGRLGAPVRLRSNDLTS